MKLKKSQTLMRGVQKGPKGGGGGAHTCGKNSFLSRITCVPAFHATARPHFFLSSLCCSSPFSSLVPLSYYFKTVPLLPPPVVRFAFFSFSSCLTVPVSLLPGLLQLHPFPATYHHLPIPLFHRVRVSNFAFSPFSFF